MTWGLKQLRIPKMWSKAKTKGKGINVAVLDTGVHGDHPALLGRVKDFIVVDPLGRRIKSTPTFDCGTHGTHVCGTIAGAKSPEKVSIGVAPDANLFVAGVLVGDATLRTLLEGITWAIEKGADIINMSLGFDYYEPLFAEVFKILIEQYGILPVVAVGTYMDGTSMATPHVSGVAALLMSAKPQAPVTEIIEALKKTAKHPLGVDARPDNRWGYGMIQPLEALSAL